MPTGELHRRSILKSVTFRIVVLISDFVIVMLITHRYDFAIGVIIATNLGSAVFYYLHERVWSRVKWGLKR